MWKICTNQYNKSNIGYSKTVIGKVDNIDNFNISPGQEAAVIKKYSNGRALELGIGVFFQAGQRTKRGLDLA